MFKKFLSAAALAGCMLINSSAAQAIDARVESAVQFAIDIANDNTHGYSQGAENATASNPYTGSRESPDYDCSSLVYHSFEHGGFKIIEAWRNNPEYMARYQGQQYSGDADTIFDDLSVEGGWKKFSWYEIKDNLQRGDILCNPETHVAIYIGDGKTVEARGVNNPTGAGRYETGDQGGEIDFYNAYGRNWTEVYRYVGE
ncbi:MAG: C40 family peptidase [Selenomonadaceae bacterium]|nr:C40 family peptidase [Selenomonadaceae bacterium]